MTAFVVDRKVAVGAAVGGLVSIFTWALSQFAGVTVPAEVGIGATTLLTFVTQWGTRNKVRE